ncbi:methyltransferase domain-containing protein [Saccharothrix sp.]|uniref:class I SAM-dependent DNA methyltransferase n=1 Tax=Saccharothrix sp. TaxID=1873460 RepID=UPI002810A898|nr:methyltransferase domain-containing protein [Saccharothrix sp.]
MTFLEPTRAAYDTVAESYHEALKDVLAENRAGSVLDRAMLGAFAELVTGRVADVGCGPGRITGHLAALGLDVFGVDLSPEMVAIARRTHPDVRFEVGSMTALDLPDGSLGGLVAWYSVIHVPPAEHPAVFAEFHRVLAPGGHLLLGFQVGDEAKHITEAYGHSGLDAMAYRLNVDKVAADLAGAGFTPHTTLVREPLEEYEKTPQAYVLVRR